MGITQVVSPERSPMDVSLSHLSGRTCNNLIQIINAIHMARGTQGTFTFTIDHQVINTFHVSFVVDKDKPRKPFQAGFFFDNEAHISNQQKREILHLYIVQHLKLPKVPTIPSKTLVVHIRGGDICTTNPHPLYVQPPLSFYVRVFKTSGYSNIHIVTSKDRSNPVILALVRAYGNRVTIQSSDLNTDMATLMAAEHLAINSMGSFGRMLMLGSKRVRECHIPYYRREDASNPYHSMQCLKATKVHAYYIHNYIQPGQWTFDTSQQQTMLTHPSTDVIKI